MLSRFQSMYQYAPRAQMIASDVTRSLREMSQAITPATFKEAYTDLKRGESKFTDQFSGIPSVNPQGVFGTSNCSLKYVNAYGFDYDHTLANYNRKSGNIIYENALNYLIQHENYPIELAKNEFNPQWAVRGLQFDRLTGNVMKLNQFYTMNPRSIIHGHSPVHIKEMLSDYGGLRISEAYYNQYIKDLTDLFGVPECNLICDVIQFLKDKKYDFEVEYVAADIQRAIDHVHDQGVFHKTVGRTPEAFVRKLPRFSEYIKKLKNGGKKVFLLTNTKYDYLDNACEYLFEDVVSDLGLSHWTQLFDWTFTCASKPKWFNSRSRFRSYSPPSTRHEAPFKAVDTLEDCGVFTGGSLQEFHRLTRLRNDQVIYFGDNIGSDLIGPSRTGQWKTVAVIKELEREIEVNNDDQFRSDLSYLLDIEHLWFDAQHLRDLNDDDINNKLSELRKERGIYREIIKKRYNQQFGSIFRTHVTRTLFFHRLVRYSDLYTSKVTNMLEYPLYYKFGARRQFYDHEPVL
eukprot:325417_1